MSKKTALITGAGRRLGAAIASYLAGKDITVIVQATRFARTLVIDSGELLPLLVVGGARLVARRP